MWTGYGPLELYEEKMTVLEMICASPCFVAMICFSLEVKYGNMYNTEAHMNRHRVGARGNVTCFPLPWESLLEQLREVDKEMPSLPRSPEEIASIVRIIL